MKKLLLLTAGGIGYVLGARAGRGRYDQIANLAGKVKSDPHVRDAAHRAADTAKAQAPAVKDRVTSAAGTVADKVRPSGHHDGTGHPGGPAEPRQRCPAGQPLPAGQPALSVVSRS
ncbi:hypothetical protein [Nocardioides sp. B-3]|uniref:hypothetical protein n=1 Tax=Nocardioides sp. B-3 TaxID=2895565 RepID=UPI002153A063|nr:hypothetical protein [Nocardioides sp. B-3]UUZ58561.1 hypothetical protein LP418_20740 [Nocardioides sp. B-3]